MGSFSRVVLGIQKGVDPFLVMAAERYDKDILHVTEAERNTVKNRVMSALFTEVTDLENSLNDYMVQICPENINF